MVALTDGAIRRALKLAEQSRKETTLADGEGRGTGRLVLHIKPTPRRITAEWMAQQWREGRRTKAKIGTYPLLSLAGAREIFQRDFAEAIQKRREHQARRRQPPGHGRRPVRRLHSASEGSP